MFNDKLSFLSSNVKGIKLKYSCAVCVSPRNRLFRRCKKKKKKKNGTMIFTDSCFFSHDKTNLCGVAIGYYGKKVFQTSEQIY